MCDPQDSTSIAIVLGSVLAPYSPGPAPALPTGKAPAAPAEVVYMEHELQSSDPRALTAVPACPPRDRRPDDTGSARRPEDPKVLCFQWLLQPSKPSLHCLVAVVVPNLMAPRPSPCCSG